MKRMTRRLLAIVASSAVALPMAAQVQADEMEMKVEPHDHPAMYEHEHEMEDGSMAPLHAHAHPSHPHSELHGHSATVYGSLRYGMTMSDDGKSDSKTKWELGNDYGSRFGIKGSVGAGAGLTAGFQIERAISDTLDKRFHNVSLSGAYGTITLGRQGSTYYGATTWDGAAHLGGVTDVGDKIDGVSIKSSLGGPFDFAVLASTGDDLAKEAKRTTGNRADHIEASGSLALGPVSFGAGYREEADDGKRIGGMVSGTMANITLKMGYESAKDITCIEKEDATVKTSVTGTSVTHTVDKAAVPKKMCDEDRYGFDLSYLVGEGAGGGKAYVQYGERKSDEAGTNREVDERNVDYWTLGYSYYVSDAVTVNLVHRTKDAYNKKASMRLRDRTSAVVMKVDF